MLSPRQLAHLAVSKDRTRRIGYGVALAFAFLLVIPFGLRGGLSWLVLVGLFRVWDVKKETIKNPPQPAPEEPRFFEGKDADWPQPPA